MSLLHSFYCWGQLGHRGHLHAVSVCVRHRLMAGSRLLVGDCACHRHRDVRWRSHAAHCAGRHGDHAVRRLVEEAGVLPDVPYDAVRGAAEQGMSPVGQRVRRVRSGRDQGDWRLGGTCRIRPDDGPVPHDLRSAGASTGSHGIHCQQFRTVRGHVSDRSPNHGHRYWVCLPVRSPVFQWVLCGPERSRWLQTPCPVAVR